MLQWFVKILSVPILGSLVDAYKARLAVQGSKDVIAGELAGRAIMLEAKEREVNAKLLTVEQGHWFTRWVRPMWAAPFVIYTWKVVVWDITLAMGVTDPIRGAMGEVMMAVVIAYFGGRTIEKIVGSIWRR